MSKAPEPPRYSKVTPEPLIHLQYTEPAESSTETVIPARKSPPLPYKVGTVCVLVETEDAVLDEKYTENIFGLSIINSQIKREMELKARTKVVIRQLLNRKLGGHGDPLEAKYAEYIVEYQMNGVSCNLPDPDFKPISVEISQLKKPSETTPILKAPAPEDRLYLTTEVGELPKDSAVIVSKVVPTKFSKPLIWVQKLSSKPCAVMYVVDRNVVHAELELLPE